MRRRWNRIILAIVGVFIFVICFAPTAWWAWQGLQIHDWPGTEGVIESTHMDPAFTRELGAIEEPEASPYRACFIGYTYSADGTLYHGSVEEPLHKSALNPEFWYEFPKTFKPGRTVVVRYSPENYGHSFLPEIAKVFMWKEFYEGFFNFVWSSSLVVIIYFAFRSHKKVQGGKKKRGS